LLENLIYSFIELSMNNRH